MITQPLSEEKLEDFTQLYNQYKHTLQANRKSGEQLLAYLKKHYDVIEATDQAFVEMVAFNIMHNEYSREKVDPNKALNIKKLVLKNEGRNTSLFKEEEALLWGKNKNCIEVGIDTNSAYYCVSGSTALWDELCAYQGLDVYDLQNVVCVGQYLQCLQQFPQVDDRGQKNG